MLERTYGTRTQPAAAAPSGLGSVGAARTGITHNTEGRATELANDPRMKQAMDFFSKTMAGGEGPYTDASKQAMLNKHASGSAGAQASQMKALQDATAASGGSIYDPSFAAKSQELNANRQASNIDASGKIEADAAGANFAAKASGANSLAATRSAQNAQINDMRRTAAEHQGRVTEAVPTKVGGIAGQAAAPGPKQMTPWEISQQVSAQNKRAFMMA